MTWDRHPMRRAATRRGRVLGLAAAVLSGWLVAACGTVTGGSGSSPAAPPAASPPTSSTSPAAPSKPGQGAQAGAANGGAAPMHWSSPPAMSIDASRTYTALLHTNLGDVTIELLAKQAPHTVNNFVFLAKKGFYNNDRFFRIIQSFMLQTGDPNNNGTGGPGYTFADELPPALPYGPGIVAMANRGPNTNGSQFFICTNGPGCAGLNRAPNYTVFGKVQAGMNVVERIAAIPVGPNPLMGGEMSKPTQAALIQSITITEGAAGKG